MLLRASRGGGLGDVRSGDKVFRGERWALVAGLRLELEDGAEEIVAVVLLTQRDTPLERNPGT